MTIAICMKVHDGVVLAADSASTIIAGGAPGAHSVVNVYNTANKVFNLRKGLPIGAITWGVGSIGTASTSTLVKDLRRRFSGEDQNFVDWNLDPNSYTVAGVAEKLRAFVFDEHYAPTSKNWPQKPQLGFIVAGYSAGKQLAEEYQIDIQGDTCPAPRLLRPADAAGLTWSGEPEAISRLMLGFSPAIGQVMEKKLGVNPAEIPKVLKILAESLQAPLVVAPMPIQDAIDLAEFLVYLAIKFSRFTPGAPTVGGPIEIAAITRHEGFKWVHRKHYFNSTLNPEIPR